MDHMRISGTEPSSVSSAKYVVKKLNSNYQKVPKQVKQKGIKQN